jgi:hypothetical protein
MGLWDFYGVLKPRYDFILETPVGQKNFDIIAKRLVSRPYKIAASPILQTKCLVYFDK